MNDDLRQTKLELGRQRVISALMDKGLGREEADFAVRGPALERIEPDGYVGRDGLPLVSSDGTDPADLFAKDLIDEIPAHLTGRGRSSMSDAQKADYIVKHGAEAYRSLPK